ncbi:MAG: T9SS type A sorting domain-containing protein, partial [Saprospiraceae bacterium]
MKNISLILILLFSINVLFSQEKSQTEVDNFENEMNSVLQHVDLSGIPSDFFYDKAFPYIPIEQFDGSFKSTDLTINRFGKIYATLYEATLGNTTILPDASHYMEAAAESINTTSNSIPIALLLYNYHQFKENAIELNLINKIGEKLYDVPNASQSPFEEKTVFAATTVQLVSNNLFPSFIIPSTLVYSNQSADIASLKIDMGDGSGFQSFTLNQPISPSYASNGTKKLVLKCTLVDGTILYSNFELLIDAPPITEDYSALPDLNIPVPATSEHAGGLLNVFLNCPSEGLVKPFVIIDGFDPPQTANRSFTNMISRLSDVAYPDNDMLIIDFLEAEGYDLVFLDHNYGSDYLQRNGEMVEDAIDLLNAAKATSGSNEPNIIVGASMGGVIGKLALLEMERDGEVHDTETFIALDASMLGSNIPLGIQEALVHLANVDVGNGLTGKKKLKELVPQVASAYSILEEPAVKQFLFYQAIDLGLSPPQIRVDFLDELEALDAPSDFEYLAISSGSITSTPQQLFNAGDELIDINSNWNDVSEILDLATDLNSNLTTGIEIFLGFINIASAGIFNTRVKSDFDIWSLPDHPSNFTKIYHGKLKVRVLGIKIIKTDRDVSVRNTQPYDSCPGGLIGFEKTLVPQELEDIVDVKYNAYCFVPTVSSLDIKAPFNEDLFIDVSDPINVTTNLSDLDGFDASTDASYLSYGDLQENQFHAKINTTNAPYLLYKIASRNDLLNINLIEDRIYNFGASDLAFDPMNPNAATATSNMISQNLTIRNTGALWVNRNDVTGFTDEMNPMNASNSEFNVYIRRKCGVNTTVTVRDEGEMIIGDRDGAKNSGTLFIDRGGRLIIQDNGKVEADQYSAIVIGDGGTLVVKDGGVLRMTRGAKGIVKEGGVLQINDGAKLDLWWNDFWSDNQTIEGSSVHVKDGGTLRINGSFEFTGSGFFQFDKGNILTLNSTFKLKGGGQTRRFMRLNKNAVLNVGDGTIDLEKGTIEYLAESKMRIEQGGQALIKQVNFEAIGAHDYTIGIQCEQASRLKIFRANFNGFYAGIEAFMMNQPSDKFDVFLANFNQCGIGVEAELCKELNFTGCRFQSTKSSDFALNLWNVEKVNLGANIQNYSFNLGAILIYNDLDAVAKNLSETTELNFRGGTLSNNKIGVNVHDYSRVDIFGRGVTISNNEVGIKATGTSKTKTVFANVTLSKASNISNNNVGILIGKGQDYLQASTGLTKSFGTVEMTCSKLLNNERGIEGEDLWLNIDACINSGQNTMNCDYSATYANHFKNAPGGNIFRICYVDRIAIPIEATGNYWEGGQPTTNADFGDILIGSSIDYNGSPQYACGFTVSFDDSNPATTAPTSCESDIIVFEPTDLPGGGGEPEKANCLTGDGPVVCLYNDDSSENISMKSQYNTAYKAYAAENFEKSKAVYKELAEITGDGEDSYCAPCQHYINIARTRSFYSANKKEEEDGKEISKKLATPTQMDDASVRIFPNPATEVLNINTDLTDNQVQILDVHGRILFTQVGSNNYQINISDWAKGIYFVHLTNLENSTT